MTTRCQGGPITNLCGDDRCAICSGVYDIAANAAKCDHGIYLGSGECAECVGPMTDMELAIIRKRLSGHEGCVPRCDRAPSGETARLLATIDALRSQARVADIRVRAEVLEPGEWSPAPGARGTVLYHADGVLVGRVTLEPGAEVPREVHEEQEETILLVTGNLILFVDGYGDMALSKNCFAHVLGGEWHTIRNANATEPAEYIAVIRRA